MKDLKDFFLGILAGICIFSAWNIIKEVVEVWQPKAGHIVQIPVQCSPTEKLEVSHDGNTITCLGKDESFEVYKSSSGLTITRFKGGQIHGQTYRINFYRMLMQENEYRNGQLVKKE